MSKHRLRNNIIKGILHTFGYTPSDGKILLNNVLKLCGYSPKVLKAGMHQKGTGFFSCCTVRLREIVLYFNVYKQLPEEVDCSNLFTLFQRMQGVDITSEYFKERGGVTINYSKRIYITSTKDEDQYSNYKKLNFQDINLFIEKYFTPSDNVTKIIKSLEAKYHINYHNLCALYYRGNDKSLETNAPSYDDFIEKSKELKEKNPSICFLIQSDEKEFIEAMQKHFPNSIVFKDETKAIARSADNVVNVHGTLDDINTNSNFEYLLNFLAITIIISKCKHIICTSGNCSYWVILYRGNANNVQQYLSPKEYIYGLKNYQFDKNKNVFWL
ncbi:hypothetical protein ACFL3A_00375 [Pseudomonadota bacterium]